MCSDTARHNGIQRMDLRLDLTTEKWGKNSRKTEEIFFFNGPPSSGVSNLQNSRNSKSERNITSDNNRTLKREVSMVHLRNLCFHDGGGISRGLKGSVHYF